MQADDKEMNSDAGTFFCHSLDSMDFAVFLGKPSVVPKDYDKGPSRNFHVKLSSLSRDAPILPAKYLEKYVG